MPQVTAHQALPLYSPVNRKHYRYLQNVSDKQKPLCYIGHVVRLFTLYRVVSNKTNRWQFVSHWHFSLSLAIQSKSTFILSFEFLARLSLFLNLSLFHILVPRSVHGSTFHVIMITWLWVQNILDFSLLTLFFNKFLLPFNKLQTILLRFKDLSVLCNFKKKFSEQISNSDTKKMGSIYIAVFCFKIGFVWNELDRTFGSR